MTAAAARPPRIVVAITGATGVVYGVRTLQTLAALGAETHLVVSRHGALTLRAETDYTLDDLRSLATHVHPAGDVGASIASGSHRFDGMIIAPCTVKTLSGLVNGYADNLVTRAADVTLKEGRKLVIVFRETPLHLGHLRLLTAAAEMGATVFPPMPAFYHRPDSIDEIIYHTVGRVLDQFGFEIPMDRWTGLRPDRDRPSDRLQTSACPTTDV
ncbi:UbiX family flavin prenyltransferase [Streptosporangium sp. NPDC051022]|uniref:UbiX family flavin prenyltransferase n=1 Tax=Streptosporangium sp. NPDC051022 TaxID=3155752 RepID=UPI003426959B